VKIPLHELLLDLRRDLVEERVAPWSERAAFRAWAWVAQRPALYALAARLGARLGRAMGGAARLIHRLPVGAGWTELRDMPAPAGRTFRDLYRERAAAAASRSKP
jgi:L-lactate dehydrogenase complex protein LldF